MSVVRTFGGSEMRELALFAGAGGGILGGHLLGWRTVCAVEIEKYARDILFARQRDGVLPRFPVWDDVRTFNGSEWRGRVDIVTGGFPCQDISWAWAGNGIRGERSGLWVEMHRIISESMPRFVLIENVGNIRSRGIDTVLSMLGEIGYRYADGDFYVSDCGGPHLRIRTFILACREWSPVVFASECGECEMCGEPVCSYCNTHYSECSCPGPHSEDEWRVEEQDWGVVAYNNLPGLQEQWRSIAVPKKHAPLKRTDWWRSEPNVGRVVHGIPNRVDRLKAIGNAQSPAVAALAFRVLYNRLMEAK